MSSDLVMRETPKLNGGSLVIGLSGWGNAGSVSTLCVSYMIEKLDAVEIGEIIPGRFYDYQAQRPHVSIEKGVIRAYDPPRNLFYYCKAKSRRPAVLLLKGTEPHIDWSGYARRVLEAVEMMGVRRIYMIGSYVGDIPHTVEPVISVSATSAEFLRGISHLGMRLTDYDGPTGIYSEILEGSHERGIEAMSIWGAVPPYVEGPDPKVAFHILEKIVSIIGVDVPLLDMKGKGEDLDEKIAEEAKQNPELRRLISSLEIEYRAMRKFDSYIV